MECYSRFYYDEFQQFYQNICNFFHVLNFFLQQRPWDVLQVFIISCCIGLRVNGMLINIFCDSCFSNFWIKFKIFKILENFYVPNVWIFEPVKLCQVSLQVKTFLPFCSRFISLVLTLYLFLSLSLFIDAALQLLLCEVRSSSLILINNEL